MIPSFFFCNAELLFYQGYHMKLVLDYIYGGAMYLCGAHMQYVIQVSTVPYNPVLRSRPFLNESGAEI